ncbi:MAG: AbrB/MazE/SpoVT family DNA-binding domain-containing protein [Chloroflexi bacterium]|nr:MAG: AbrB/MazE/SpoVT family DNA-binding domain-containing protein [Chloroflexota bacterium]
METAKLFQNGSSQAVRLPKEFRFRGNRVYIKKMGDAVILLPVHNSWKSLTASLALFTDDFMGARKQPETQKRKDAFK